MDDDGEGKDRYLAVRVRNEGFFVAIESLICEEHGDPTIYLRCTDTDYILSILVFQNIITYAFSIQTPYVSSRVVH